MQSLDTTQNHNHTKNKGLITLKLSEYTSGLLSALKGRPKNQVNLVGAPSFREVNPYGLYKTYRADEYGSIYPNIRPIVNELMTIIPHAVDKNAKRVENVAAINALYHPNKTDSRELFVEKLSVSVLSLPYTYLLVWRNEGGEARPGGNYGFKGKNIAGFTFLECPAIEYRDGRVYYKIGAQEFTEDEVIAIPGGAQPGDLYGGYSPTQSIGKWATIDGYIADFEKGFFENNAIPAGMFNVVAATTKEFNDMVDKLQEKHRGAGNNNNVTYSHKPIDANGKPTTAQIEWVPFQQSNKDIDFDPILTHTDKRLGEAFGVSSIIKGDDSSAKYSNAEVSEANFAKRAVRPVAIRIYSQITHELNRITGGLGYAITFKYEIPAVSDAEKVKEETKKIGDERVQAWLDKGYSLSSIKEYMRTGDLEALEVQEVKEKPEDNPDVDEGNEVDGAPDRTEIDGVTPIRNEIHCSSCDRFLGETAKDSIEEKLKCACKAFEVPTVRSSNG